MLKELFIATLISSSVAYAADNITPLLRIMDIPKTFTKIQLEDKMILILSKYIYDKYERKIKTITKKHITETYRDLNEGLDTFVDYMGNNNKKLDLKEINTELFLADKYRGLRQLLNNDPRYKNIKPSYKLHLKKHLSPQSDKKRNIYKHLNQKHK